MSPKVRKIIGWVLAAAIAIMFVMGASMNLMHSPEQKAQMAKMGITISDQTAMALGIVQLLCAVLFIIPRTGVLGTLMLTAWLGGAISFHVLRNESFMTAAIFQAVVWITAWIRFPELGWRLLRGNVSA